MWDGVVGRQQKNLILKPYLWDGVVGRQQKNQSLRGATFATARRSPFKFLYKVYKNMTKTKAISIITNAAKSYKEFFCNRNILIIYGSPNKPNLITTKADSKNFYHLTGVELNKKNILRDVPNKNTNAIDVFFEKALSKKLSLNDFKFKNEFTELKLSVLEHTLAIASNASMIGDYSNSHINLHTDKIAGGQYSFLGFVKEGDYYVPNTVMADDMRKNSNSNERVLAILSKTISEKEYGKIEKVAKNIDINRLLQTIQKDISISSNLLIQAEPETKLSDNLIDLEKRDEIYKVNPSLKDKLNEATREYYQRNNITPLDENASETQCNEIRKNVLKANPNLMEEYISAQKALEQSNVALNDNGRQLITSAARQTKSFEQGLNELVNRGHSENASRAKPNPINTQNTKHKR